MKPRQARKSVTDKDILNWIEANRPTILLVHSGSGDQIEIDTGLGCWRRKTLRRAVRAALSGVPE